MLAVEQISEWRGQEVVDSTGEKVGKLEDVYYRRGSDEAVFAQVRRGLLGRRSTLVPLASATVGRDYVRIDCAQGQIEQAEKIDVQDGILTREAAAQLGSIYQLSIDGEEDFESSTLIAQRIERAETAARRARELQEEARKRTAESDTARIEAQRSQMQAEAAETEAQRARQVAAQARMEAQELDPARHRADDLEGEPPESNSQQDESVAAGEGGDRGATEDRPSPAGP